MDAIGSDVLSHSQESGFERARSRLVVVLLLGDKVVDVASISEKYTHVADTDALSA